MNIALDIKGEKQLSELLNKLSNEIDKADLTLKMATFSLAEIRERIPKGISIDGTGFKPYSTKPYYQPLKQGFGRLRKLGSKDGKKNFKNGKTRKSVYIPGGYAQLRRELGRSTTDGRLVFTGRMLNNMSVGRHGSMSSKIYFPRPEENEKAVKNQEKYNFFGLTTQEQNSVMNYAALEVEEMLKRIAKK